MKVLKKLFVALLLVVSAFGFAACDDGSAEALAAAQAKIEELTAKIEALTSSDSNFQTTIESLQAELEALKALEKDVEELEKANSALEAELKGLIEDQGVELDLSSAAKQSLGTPKMDQALGTEVYNLDLGTTYNVGIDQFVGRTYTQEGEMDNAGFLLSSDLFEVSYGYYWLNTYDLNKGVLIDSEKGTIEFKLPGYYCVYAETEVAAFEMYVLASGVTLVNAETKEAEIEAMAGKTIQLAPESNDGLTWTLSNFASSKEAVATVSATGLVTLVAPGSAAITATATAEGKEPRQVSIPVTVVVRREASELAGGSEGANFNLKYADLETKTQILAHMERYLLNSGASIPVINNSGMAVYSERVNFYTKNGAYVAQMGFGATMVAPTVSDTVPAVTISHEGKDYTVYRSYESADPSTLNHLNYADSVESDFLGLLLGSLVSMEWTEDAEGYGNGWTVVPSMSALPVPVAKNPEGKWETLDKYDGLTTCTSWEFKLRSDLKWQNGDPIKADDFIYTFQQVLDPKLSMKRANYFYGGSTPIKGAKDYFDGKTSDWSTVGIEKTSDLSFVVTYTQAMTEWDVEYSWAGFLQTPIHKATWEACLSEDGRTTTYGTEPSKFMASGPFKISYWEKGKEYRFVKNDQYFGWGEGSAEEPVEIKMGGYEAYTYAIVKDSNAALELFRQGLIDVTSVPASAYEEFKNYPNVKFAPGATSFRFSVNTATQAELDAEYGVGAWEAKPILQYTDFMWALFLGMDRNAVQSITKTSTGFDNYFTNAYSIVASTKDGVELSTYRESEWAKKVYTGIWESDIELSPESLNYNPVLAQDLYVSAVQSLIADQGKTLNDYTAENPLKIEVELAAFDGTTWEAVLQFLVAEYNKLFNNTEALGNKVVFEMTGAPQPGMDVYYVKQMTGQFDLALAGISGGTLDPMGFMECFCDDNRSGLFLNPGFDSHNANILIDLDVDGDGVKDGAKYWSFDALYEAYYGDVFVKEGVVSKAPAAE